VSFKKKKTTFSAYGKRCSVVYSRYPPLALCQRKIIVSAGTANFVQTLLTIYLIVVYCRSLLLGCEFVTSQEGSTSPQDICRSSVGKASGKTVSPRRQVRDGSERIQGLMSSP
jgi:hypothetical protein